MRQRPSYFAIPACALFCGLTSGANADPNCPSPPTQVSSDFEGEVKTAVGHIGPVKGAELEVKAKKTTQNLIEKLPEANTVYLEQMMWSAYCGILMSSDFTPKEKLEQIRIYRGTVTKTLDAPAAGDVKPVSNQNRAPVLKKASGRYEVTACESIIDRNTGLEWFVGPDKTMTWDAAKEWTESLGSCGGGWRMPTTLQLAKLYTPGKTAGQGFVSGGQHWPAHIDEVFSGIGGGSWVWSKENFRDNAWSFNFNQNYPVNFEKRNPKKYSTRAFAVRNADQD